MRIFILCTALLSISLLTSAQTIIWGGPGDPNSEFDGGLNDWTAEGIFCSQGASSNNAAWEHSTTGQSVGGFSSDDRIMSPSFNNGVALFDSDWLDNGGDPNNFNGGVCPVLHRGELISPVMNFSGHSTVILRFNQFFRWYLGPNNSETEPPSSVHVSNNGGNSWTKFVVNEDVEFDEFTPADDVVTLDISNIAANQSNVRIKFVFEGDAYFWMIDDVYVLGGEVENDLSMDLHYFHPTARYIPQAYQDAEEFPFSARISNDGGNDISNAFLKVQIINNNQQEMWADSMALDPISSGTSGRVEIADFTYLPQGLTPGLYVMRYTVYQPGIEDATPGNNTRTSTFFITNNSFWQSADPIGYIGSGFDEDAMWGWGSFFITSPNTQESFNVSSIEATFAGQTSAGDLNGQMAEAYLMEVTSFDVGSAGTTIDDGMTNIVVGLGERSLSAADDFEFIEFDIEGLNGESGFVLDNGTPYKVMLVVDERVLIGYDDDFVNVPLNLGDGDNASANIFYDGEFAGFSYVGEMPYIKLNLRLVTTADEKPLPESAIKVFPNPAEHYTNVQFDMENATDVTITLADMNGRVLWYNNWSGIQRDLIPIDLSRLSAGQYIIRVASGMGTSTKTITVTK